MIAGLYVDRDSPLHRLRPGAKLLLLPVFGTVLFMADALAVAAGALVLVAGLYALARIPARLALSQLGPVLPMLAVLFAAQAWLSGLDDALLLVLRFAVLILAASLVTLTTRTAALVGALERGLGFLSRFGVDAEKASLAISLAFRFIPVIARTVSEVREAQQARGQDRSILALAVPVLVRVLKMADEVAEAIDARS